MKRRQGGFIDPLSLISLGFLVISLIVGGFVVNQRKENFDIRERAAYPTIDEPCKICSNQKCVPSGIPRCSPSLNECSQDKNCQTPPTKTPIPSCNTGNCYSDCICKGNTPSECNAACQTPTPTPTPTPFPKCSDLGACYRSSYVCEREYGQMDCRDSYKCGVHCSAPTPTPTPVPTPTPTPITITKSDYQKCLDIGNSPSECSGIAQNIGKTVTTPTGQTECVPGTKLCSNSNLKICSNSGTWELITCQYGCAKNACKPQPVTPPTPSNTALVNTYNVLNTVTFGTFGNYVQTYQDINAQNPEASYLEKAFNPEGIAASAQLGVVLTAEGAIAVTGAQVIGGLPVAILMAQNVLAASPVLQTAAAVATLSQLPVSIIACQTYGADSPQCQYTAMGITAGYYSDVIGSGQALQSSANTLTSPVQNWINSQLSGLDFSPPNAGTLGTYGGQTVLPQPGKTLEQINREIDALVAKGTPELEAITQVGAASIPEYARTPEQIATLQLADKARTAEEVLQCQYTWCRQNSIVSDAVLESRGYQPYRAIMTMQTTEGLSAGGHHASAIFVNGEPVFIDFTSNLIIRGPQALEQIFINKGMTLNTLQLSTLTSPWEVINLLP